MAQPEFNKIYKRQLPVPLKTKERAEKGDQLNDHMSKKEQIETEMKEAISGFKARIATQDKIISAIRREMNTGERIVEIDCMDIPNHETKQIETHRLDVSRRHPDRIVERVDMSLFEELVTAPEDQADGEALADAEHQLTKDRKRKTAKPRIIKAKPQTPAEAETIKPPRARRPKKAGGNGAAEVSHINGADPAADPDDFEDDEPLVAGGEFEAGTDAINDYAH